MLRYVLIFMFLSLQLKASAEGINFFNGTFAEAKAEAAKQHKLIFMDCFTTWCGPCNMMARDIFPRQDVGDYYNAHFVCIKVDMEKGEGLDIAKQFAVHGYPTYLFLDANGMLEHRTLGSRPAATFIEDGKKASDPDRNLLGQIEKFNRGIRDTASLVQLMATSYGIDNKLCERALTAYWNAIPESQIVEKHNWDVFSSYENNMNSKAFQYVAEHKSEFAGYGAETVNNILYGKAAAEIRIAADTKDKVLFDKASAFVKTCKDKEVNVAAGTNTLRYYRKTEQWTDYIGFADSFLAKYGDKQEIYNSVAWEIVSNSDDAKVLNHALDYITRGMKLEKNYGNSDTWANVLYKLKRYKEAEAAAKESIELAKKEKLDYVSTQELLDKIEKEMAGSTGK